MAMMEAAMCCVAVDTVAGALTEGDLTFDFLGPVQADSIMQQVAEGKFCYRALHGVTLLTIFVMHQALHACALRH